MAKTSGLNTTGILSRVTVAAITAALVATTTSAMATEAPKPRSADAVQQSAPAASAFNTTTSSDAQVNALYGVDSTGFMYGYAPTGTGGLDTRMFTGSGWEYTKQITQVDRDADGSADGIWAVTNGALEYLEFGQDPWRVGGGWGVYNKVISTGNLGGAAADDLLARDNSGVLYIYLGYGDGKVTSRVKVGAGWNAYTQIAGKGDLNNDGKDDIVARDGSGILWLYKGTGNYKAPFQARTKIGAGWNAFNSLVSVGDIDLDGITDLVARDSAGKLYRYSGSGVASAPFKPKALIGTGGWNAYRLLF
ncbi:FG-GAP repeat domain-containing protein [Streptomyces sp. NPDC090127]|uniref:FG-GAP repeat domain-containing protein n=1 Tax=Streptomyces sp. NPDC090127 TaxID=3365953 RepID=UPI00381081A5